MFLEAQKSADVLKKRIQNPTANLSIADASSVSGLSLEEAKQGLYFLVDAYRGHLSATEKGEVLFSFPTGFTKPWEKIEKLDAAWQKVKTSVLGVAKFVVRAWISVVMVAYVVIFAAIVIGLSFAKSSDRDDRDSSSSFGGTLLLHSLLRMVSDALFWTFHPFSPFAVGYNDPYAGRRVRKSELPFYEKVNRFFFGPEKPKADPLEMQRLIVQTIRAKKGRIGLSDVMRVTGLTRDKADGRMARIMLDYNGDVEVSEEGGLVYLFPEIRKTAGSDTAFEPEPIWSKKEQLLPLTGNPSGSNLLIGGLNGFNWFMSTVAISNGWTLEKLSYMFTAGAKLHQQGFLPPAPMESAPLLLGWIPFWFSTVLFALPLIRWFYRPQEQKKVDHENGRRGMLRAVLSFLTPGGISEETLKESWQQSAGVEPSNQALVREAIMLGGELDVSESGQTAYRFRDLEAESKAVTRERARASDVEKEVGQVVYSSS